MRAFSRYSRTAECLLFGLLFLFFFQLLTDFIAGVYAFGLMGLNIPPELASVLLLFSPLLLVFFRRPPVQRVQALLGGIMIACRMVESLLATRERMLVSGLGTACFLLLFAGLLAGREEDGAPDETSLGLGLALGVGLAVLLRAAGSGIDLATIGMFKGISWLLGALAVGLYLFARGTRPPEKAIPAPPAREQPGSFGKLAGLSIGIGAGFTLLYFGFIAPNVIARWMDAGRLPVYAGVCLALAAFAGLAASPRLRAVVLRPGIILGWNLLFVLALSLALLSQTERFPADPQAYPLTLPAAPTLHVWQGIALAAALLLFPVILVDVILYIREIRCLRPSTRRVGAGLSLAGLLMLLLVFGQVFTTVYDYIPVVGPPLRDRFWLVYLAGGLALALPLALVDWKRLELAPRLGRIPQPGITAAPIAAAGLAALLVAEFIPAAPRQFVDAGPQLRVLTYNIQQGYSAGGQKNATGQLMALRRANADIIGLQETDTNRIAGSNDDLVGYLAGELGMYSYYGPDTVKGTFGIALLSRYPIQDASTYYMYSKGEQTAAIRARVVKAGRTFNIFVTHLGNGGPLIQQQQFLQGTAGLENVVAMGDFNFDPREDPYRLTVKSLPDAWMLRWPSGADDAGHTIAEEIDHIFVSPGTQVGEARYLPGPDSDHPALMVEVDW